MEATARSLTGATGAAASRGSRTAEFSQPPGTLLKCSRVWWRRASRWAGDVGDGVVGCGVEHIVMGQGNILPARVLNGMMAQWRRDSKLNKLIVLVGLVYARPSSF